MCMRAASFSVLQSLKYGQFPLLNGMLWVVCLWELAVLPLLGFYTEFKAEFESGLIKEM